MKIVGLIPYWLDYEIVEKQQVHKNLKKLGGSYLINYSLNSLNRTPSVDSTYVFASNKKILNYIEADKELHFLERPVSLDSNNVSIEDIIDSFLEKIDTDVIVMMHPNTPFLQSSTIQECIDSVCSKSYDSAFTAFQHKKLAWFDGKPLNYSLSEPTPHLSKLEPVVIEQSALYVFSKESYLDSRSRIGKKPFMKIINHFEGHEINEIEDYQVAELIVNSGMYSEL